MSVAPSTTPPLRSFRFLPSPSLPPFLPSALAPHVFVCPIPRLLASAAAAASSVCLSVCQGVFAFFQSFPRLLAGISCVAAVQWASHAKVSNNFIHINNKVLPHESSRIRRGLHPTSSQTVFRSRIANSKHFQQSYIGKFMLNSLCLLLFYQQFVASK